MLLHYKIVMDTVLARILRAMSCLRYDLWFVFFLVMSFVFIPRIYKYTI